MNSVAPMPPPPTLFTAYQRFDYDFVLTILLAIIAIIMVSEIASGWLRKVFQ